ncbi:MarC family membrane protein [Vibrio harveyi]|jgi:multiple antibiotic resistance protein|uniref:MarC family NAAT transporter n=1 Tax=Vibrio harveyi group TaxID=717610 RepID=UPI0005395423|nr:MarC family NAAT transporter [Vibrio harveyi]AIV05696.1 MarC family membrane protein [Vibrio harveyi]EKO3805754.1 MarC family NAAT transporter [Vibrio harveyi]EKO3855248.1 MarC family NAAT transporter [Vibrio harveyi]HDM8154034.1 MarC family NAAT transporter [Vibrio harveyi]HDM8157060.1 MarC family NAAT transporter [Vibrio harveyi]
MHLETLFTYMTLTVLGLLPIMNPPAAATVLLGLSKGRDKNYIVSQAKTTGVYLFIALCITFFIGASVLELFSISIPSLRLGGGIIIVAIGFNMLFPRPDNGAAPSGQDSIALVPLTIPSLCGPGSMAMIISLAAQIATYENHANMISVYSGVVAGLALVALIATFTLTMAYPLLKALGQNGINAFTRIMGFLLICMGVQFFTLGIQEIVIEINELL